MLSQRTKPPMDSRKNASRVELHDEHRKKFLENRSLASKFLNRKMRGSLRGAAGLGAFGIHKAALTVLTKTLALEEIGNGITVNMVAPGSTQGAGALPEEARLPVKNIPLGRRVTVDEVVGAILYFLSDTAAGVTGQCLGINGGLST
jgi:2-hydroxycyclohexanecarboxyl-CoA dehydrogenase